VARDLILGSLQLLRAGPLRGRLVDVGSGAGLPGIPLAAVLPALHVTLIEPRQKRVAFLEKVVRSLALADRVEIIPEPVEAVLGGHLVGRTPPLPFDWAVARAFRPPAAWLELADRLLAPGGRAALYTTRRRFPSLAAVDPEGRFREVARVEDETGDDRLVVVVERVGDAA
jgi:16S rRNA (guanine527-N7)-methyltransferase